MKKIIVLSIVLASAMIACKKKKDDASPSTPATNKTPEVSITSPENNSTSNAEEITISATATDKDGSISKVEFYDYDTKLGEDATSPYSLDVTLNPNTHRLTAKAYDDKNAYTISNSVNYTVESGPVVAEPQPADPDEPTGPTGPAVPAGPAVVH